MRQEWKDSNTLLSEVLEENIKKSNVRSNIERLKLTLEY